MVEQVILGLKNKETGAYSPYVPKTVISKTFKFLPISKNTRTKAVALYPLETFYEISSERSKPLHNPKYEPVFLNVEIDLTKKEIEEAVPGDISKAILFNKTVTVLNEVKEPAVSYAEKTSAVHGQNKKERDYMNWDILTYDFGSRPYSQAEFEKAIVPIVRREIYLSKNDREGTKDLPDVSLNDLNFEQVLQLDSLFKTDISIGRNGDANVSSNMILDYVKKNPLTKQTLDFCLRIPGDDYRQKLLKTGLLRHAFPKQALSSLAKNKLSSVLFAFEFPKDPKLDLIFSALHTQGFDFSTLFVNQLESLKETDSVSYDVLAKGNQESLEYYAHDQGMDDEFNYYDDDDFYEDDDWDNEEEIDDSDHETIVPTLAEASTEIIERIMPNYRQWVDYVSASAFKKATHGLNLEAMESAFLKNEPSNDIER